MPDAFLEGSCVTRRGKTRIVGKPYKPTRSRKKLPPLKARHHGDQNDLGIDPDYPMHLDPTLPTLEDVRGSYGNVSNFLLVLLITHCGIEPK
jgi:hypothetical protein